jgi:hypothetical protein
MLPLHSKDKENHGNNQQLSLPSSASTISTSGVDLTKPFSSMEIETHTHIHKHSRVKSSLSLS